MAEPKYSMLLTEEVPDRGPEWWVIYPTSGNYIHDEHLRLPAGNKVLEVKARAILEQLNK